MGKIIVIPKGSALERAKKADLVTLPEDVKGTNCANCKFVDLVTNPEKPMCRHVEVDQQVSPRMCCALWDAKGVKRAWLK